MAGPGKHPPAPVLGCAPAERIDADRAAVIPAMIPLPPVAPVTGWRLAPRLPRDYYVRYGTSDYPVHPAVIGRRGEVTADLARVRVFCEGKRVADHERIGAGHQAITDREHLAAARTLRRQRLELLRPAAGPQVEVRRLAGYGTALGLDGGVA